MSQKAESLFENRVRELIVSYSENLPHRVDDLVKKILDEVRGAAVFQDEIFEITVEGVSWYGQVPAAKVVRAVDSHLHQFPIGLTPDTYYTHLRPKLVEIALEGGNALPPEIPEDLSWRHERNRT